jgi:hypothetical protein
MSNFSNFKIIILGLSKLNIQLFSKNSLEENIIHSYKHISIYQKFELNLLKVLDVKNFILASEFN